MDLSIDSNTSRQIEQCVEALKDVLNSELIGIYLYGSALIGGLQKYSDIDIFAVIKRATTSDEKTSLSRRLLEISGLYMKSTDRPIELTIVVSNDIIPWRYPPQFDFQYGEWLRENFQKNDVEPWPNKEMPDLAILITQLLLSNKTLYGQDANEVLPRIPYQDFIHATTSEIPNWKSEIVSDTRNVLLALARIWCTVETDTILPKPEAASWAIKRLPENLSHALERARAICIGHADEYWDDLSEEVKACADFIINNIEESISLFGDSKHLERCIKI